MSEPDQFLASISNADRMLAEAQSMPEVMQIADVAETARIYARRIKASAPIINRATEIKLKAERKAGALLAGMELKQGRKGIDSNALSLNDLGISLTQSSRWQRAALVPEEEFQAYVAQSNNMNKEITSAGLYKLANTIAPKNGAREPDLIDGTCTDLGELITAGHKFGTIYADPPWRYNNQGTRASTGNHYDGDMSVDEICAMPIPELTTEQAHLHLWTTNAFLFECPRIFAAWGFEFKSSFVWVKPQMGIGNYWRNSHEIMLLAVKGGKTAISKGEKSWVECGRGAHSAKPDIIRESIQRLSPGPYLELFGRRKVEGWTVFGNQIIEELF